MIWVLILFLVFIAIILFWVAPKISEYRTILGIDDEIAAASSFFERVRLRVMGLKTVIVGMLGTLAIAVPEALQMFAGINLTPWIGPDYNAKVAVAIAIATTITHLVGVVASAKAEPRKESE